MTKTKTQFYALLGLNIFQGWIFSRSEYFSGVTIFQEWIFFRGEYFQEWIFFRGEYFSGATSFQGGIFFKGWTFFRYTHSLNIWLSHNLLGLVCFNVCFFCEKSFLSTFSAQSWKILSVDQTDALLFPAMTTHTWQSSSSSWLTLHSPLDWNWFSMLIHEVLSGLAGMNSKCFGSC